MNACIVILSLRRELKRCLGSCGRSAILHALRSTWSRTSTNFVFTSTLGTLYRSDKCFQIVAHLRNDTDWQVFFHIVSKRCEISDHFSDAHTTKNNSTSFGLTSFDLIDLGRQVVVPCFHCRFSPIRAEACTDYTMCFQRCLEFHFWNDTSHRKYWCCWICFQAWCKQESSEYSMWAGLCLWPQCCATFA
jgi:hypothetical protein